MLLTAVMAIAVALPSCGGGKKGGSSEKKESDKQQCSSTDRVTSDPIITKAQEFAARAAEIIQAEDMAAAEQLDKEMEAYASTLSEADAEKFEAAFEAIMRGETPQAEVAVAQTPAEVAVEHAPAEAATGATKPAPAEADAQAPAEVDAQAPAEVAAEVATGATAQAPVEVASTDSSAVVAKAEEFAARAAKIMKAEDEAAYSKLMKEIEAYVSTLSEADAEKFQAAAEAAMARYGF